LCVPTYCEISRRDVERNEFIENDVQLAGEAAQRIPMRAMLESENSASKSRSKTFFSQGKDFL
jgi:hypothetical protein